MAGSDTYVVERRSRIDAPSPKVLERIVELRRWQSWSPWEDLDPNLRRTYTGPASGAGATYEWEGNRKAGKGRMEIERIDPDGTVTIAIEFLKPFKSKNTTTFRLQPDGDATDVTWTMRGPKTFATKVMGLFKSMDDMIGPDFEKGLAQLKADAEGS